MSGPVTVDVVDGVATVTMDDGKVNAMSPTMLAAIGAALDEVESASDVGAVVLAGRPGRFSAGFDLGVMAGGDTAAIDMVRSGFELAERVLALPRPVVVACTGHAIAMGVFLLFSGDLRVGSSDAEVRLHANEVAIGLTMPLPAVAILRHRLTPSAFDRAVVMAEPCGPGDAVRDGWLDRVVDPEAVVPTAQALATAALSLDRTAHAGSKLRARSELLAAISDGIEREFGRLAAG